MADKFTFKQFTAQYPDDDACLRAILTRQHPMSDESCPNCGIVGKLSRIEGRRAFACKEGCHVYPCAGTVFEKSSTNLTLWFHAMYLMTATRNGVSAKELQRQLGVTYKCAWRIGHQLRILMAARRGRQGCRLFLSVKVLEMQVTTQLELVKQRLFEREDGLRASNFKLFPGNRRDATAEQVAQEINASLDRIESGDFEIVEDPDSDK